MFREAAGRRAASIRPRLPRRRGKGRRVLPADDRPAGELRSSQRDGLQNGSEVKQTIITIYGLFYA